MVSTRPTVSENMSISEEEQAQQKSSASWRCVHIRLLDENMINTKIKLSILFMSAHEFLTKAMESDPGRPVTSCHTTTNEIQETEQRPRNDKRRRKVLLQHWNCKRRPSRLDLPGWALPGILSSICFLSVSVRPPFGNSTIGSGPAYLLLIHVKTNTDKTCLYFLSRKTRK